VDRIASGSAQQRTAAVSAVNTVIAIPTIDAIVAGATFNGVVAETTDDRVIACRCEVPLGPLAPVGSAGTIAENRNGFSFPRLLS